MTVILAVLWIGTVVLLVLARARVKALETQMADLLAQQNRARRLLKLASFIEQCQHAPENYKFVVEIVGENKSCKVTKLQILPVYGQPRAFYLKFQIETSGCGEVQNWQKVQIFVEDVLGRYRMLTVEGYLQRINKEYFMCIRV
jgi:hypothetical protein